MVPGTGIEPVRLAPRDFKSLVSTNFTIRADPLAGGWKRVLGGKNCWRREPESNRRRRLCRPLHNHSAIAPLPIRWGRKLKGGKHLRLSPCKLEREKSLELSTYTLARYRSTN